MQSNRLHPKRYTVQIPVRVSHVWSGERDNLEGKGLRLTSLTDSINNLDIACVTGYIKCLPPFPCALRHSVSTYIPFLFMCFWGYPCIQVYAAISLSCLAYVNHVQGFTSLYLFAAKQNVSATKKLTAGTRPEIFFSFMGVG
jgi:hypothetical protein